MVSEVKGIFEKYLVNIHRWMVYYIKNVWGWSKDWKRPRRWFNGYDLILNQWLFTNKMETQHVSIKLGNYLVILSIKNNIEKLR